MLEFIRRHESSGNASENTESFDVLRLQHSGYGRNFFVWTPLLSSVTWLLLKSNDSWNRGFLELSTF